MSNESTALRVDLNRQARKYSRAEMVKRGLWIVGQLLFKFSPRPFFGWRRMVLRSFGAKIAATVHVHSTAVIYFPWNLEVGEWSAIGEHVFIYNLGPVKIGSRATLSLGAKICAGTHDYTSPDMLLIKPPVHIGDQTWLCADSFIGPNVTVGEGAVVGARAVVMRDVPPWTIVAGNPARFVKIRTLKAAAG